MKASLPFAALALISLHAFGQGTGFTYQGRLMEGGEPAQGTYDLVFRLFNASSGGTQQGADIVTSDVEVSSGLFTVGLNFGGTPFDGSTRWLNIAVRPGASSGAYTNLV